MAQPHWLSGSGYMKDEFSFWISRAVQGSIAEHGHDFVELVYVVHGNGIHRFEGQEYKLQTGDVFIINPGETHSYIVADGAKMEIVNCLFMPSFIADSLLRELEITDSMDFFYVHPFLKDEVRFNHRLNLHGQEAVVVLSLLDGMIREFGHPGPGFRTLIRLQLIELLVLLSRYYSNMNRDITSYPSPRQLDREWLALRIYGYMERNFDKKITLDAIAGLFNISVRQLNRIIKLEYGQSVIDVLHDIRINRARQMLLESDEKVIAIATMVGYDDPSFFNRLFHRHVGCSPRQYRAEGARVDTVRP